MEAEDMERIYKNREGVSKGWVIVWLVTAREQLSSSVPRKCMPVITLWFANNDANCICHCSQLGILLPICKGRLPDPFPQMQCAQLDPVDRY